MMRFGFCIGDKGFYKIGEPIQKSHWALKKIIIFIWLSTIEWLIARCWDDFFK